MKVAPLSGCLLTPDHRLFYLFVFLSFCLLILYWSKTNYNKTFCRQNTTCQWLHAGLIEVPLESFTPVHLWNLQIVKMIVAKRNLSKKWPFTAQRAVVRSVSSY